MSDDLTGQILLEGEGSLGARLKLYRLEIGLTQEQMAAAMEVSVRAYQSYERNERAPSAEALAPLAKRDLNFNWLFTGLGEMRLSGGQASGPAEAEGLDAELLVNCMVALEDELEAHGLELSPEKRGRAVALIYQLYNQGGETRGRDSLIKQIVRAVSA